uniref:Uncharacterized protein n=1 Tax=Cannabis sativa TaxID=3483 RepID=A0A803Q3G6_CANSA
MEMVLPMEQAQAIGYSKDSEYAYLNGRRIRKPKVLMESLQPTTVQSALKDPNLFNAMDTKHQALKRNNTWILVNLPPTRTPIDCKWVCRIKEIQMAPFLHKIKISGQGLPPTS